jgi:predicted phage terminase large subunit-like protein
MVRLLSQNHPKAWTKLVEEKANGAAVMSSLHSTVGGFVPIVPKESKEARAFAITPLFESGNVYLPPLETDWVHRDLIPELMQFPSGAHDDQVDAMTQALSYLKEFGSGYAIGDD